MLVGKKLYFFLSRIVFPKTSFTIGISKPVQSFINVRNTSSYGVPTVCFSIALLLSLVRRISAAENL